MNEMGLDKNAAQLKTPSLELSRCFSDEWRDKAGLGPSNTQLSFAFALSWRAIEDISKTFCFLVIPRLSLLFSPVSLYLQALTEVAEVQAAVPYIHLTLKTEECCFSSPAPLWWINDLLLWLLALLISLEGGAV